MSDIALRLDVRLDGVGAPIGSLIKARTSAVSFQYREDYAATPDALPISLALPARVEPYGDKETRAYFANLLPENEQFQHVMEREGLARDDVIGLLYHLGADCPGAISCLPEGAPPVKIPGDLATDYDLLSNDDIAEIAQRLADRDPLPDHVREPSPVAGVQRKIALVATTDGRFALPKPGHGAPTTHILKVPARRDARDVELEAAATRLAAACGLDVAIPAAMTIGNTAALLIPRFDRQTDARGRITKVHQEDFAQALSLAPSLKYERHGGSGGVFNIEAVVVLLRQCAEPAKALDDFLRATFFNLAIGNTDNHAKNHALLYDGGRAPRFAPLYDLLPIKLNPAYTHQLAYHIGDATHADELTVADAAKLFRAFGLSTAAAVRFAQRRLTPMLEALDRAVDGTDVAKDFGDLIGTETGYLADTLELDVTLTERDFYSATGGGWTES